MSAESVSHLNFIGGEFSPGTSGKWLQKLDPRDSTLQCQLPDSDLMDVVRAVQASNKALATWSKTTPEQRAEILLKIASLIEERSVELAHAIEKDLGVQEEATKEDSIPVAIEHFRAHAWSIAPALIGKEVPVVLGCSLNSVGVVAVITPASDPLVCLASRLAPALAHANAIIAKVSRYTPATGAALARICNDAGLPAGVFNLLHGRGEEVGELLVRHPAISTLSFMGSTEKGRVVALAAAEAFKKMHYSLGAKNPALVFANTDLSVVIPQVARLCLGVHPSQCLKAPRLFIQETIFKDALELLRAEIERTPVAPLAKAAQVVQFREAVQLALKENGKVITTSGTESHGQFVKPYLFADLTNCSTLQQDEIAGPLVLASSFKYQHEALKHANVSPYGRIGYIFENDEEKALRVAHKLETGSVFINSGRAQFDSLEEISLLKSSGFSSEGGAALAKFFTRSSKVFA